MRTMIKSGFFWRFVGGFALGAVGLVAMHPGAIAHSFHPAPTEQVAAG
jgi:hypothetical protein